jgi:hypothetical protein
MDHASQVIDTTALAVRIAKLAGFGAKGPPIHVLTWTRV